MALQKEYKVALDSKLSQLWHQGFCHFTRWELLLWFDKDRITNVVWREIQERWEENYEDDDGTIPLKVISCDLSSAPQEYVVIQAKRALEISSFT